MHSYPKRLIEVDLPIKQISAHARREKSIRHGHISTLHIWWARRPLAACRAVICAALWPDPADPLCPPKFREDACRLINAFAAKAATDKTLAEHCSHDTWKKWQALAKSDGGLDFRRRRTGTYFVSHCWISSPISPIGTIPLFGNTSKRAAPSPKPLTKRWAERPARVRSWWTRLPAAAPFRSKPCG